MASSRDATKNDLTTSSDISTSSNLSAAPNNRSKDLSRNQSDNQISNVDVISAGEEHSPNSAEDVEEGKPNGALDRIKAISGKGSGALASKVKNLWKSWKKKLSS